MISMAFHLRGPFFAERLHAFSVIVRAARAVLKLGLVIEEFSEAARHRGIEPFLRKGERFSGAPRERLRELAPLRGELGVRPHTRDQTNAKRFLGGNGFARQDHVERAAPADQPGKKKGRARIGYQSDPAPGGAK